MSDARIAGSKPIGGDHSKAHWQAIAADRHKQAVEALKDGDNSGAGIYQALAAYAYWYWTMVL